MPGKEKGNGSTTQIFVYTKQKKTFFNKCVFTPTSRKNKRFRTSGRYEWGCIILHSYRARVDWTVGRRRNEPRLRLSRDVKWLMSCSGWIAYTRLARPSPPPALCTLLHLTLMFVCFFFFFILNFFFLFVMGMENIRIDGTRDKTHATPNTFVQGPIV